MKTLKGIFMVVAFLCLAGAAGAQGQRNDGGANRGKDSIERTFTRYHQTTRDIERKEILRGLQLRSPETAADLQAVRVVVKDKNWDENLFGAATYMATKVKKPELAPQLVEILQDEKTFIQKLNQNDLSGKTEQEGRYRFTNVEHIIKKLGELKSREAVPVLKEYLEFKNMQYAASEALGKIGDKSMSEEIREKAYKGEEVNYGGMGLDEANKVAQDLDDKSKKDKWPKIAKQIILIKNPDAKPQLKKLFNHEQDYVRGEAAAAFSAMAEEKDKDDILEMAKNPDWAVRCSAIDAMKHLADSFHQILVNLLKDPEHIVRLYAAKALGYKNDKEAIPFLEIALKDENLRVRQEAFIALYLIADKKNDFIGRTPAIDRQAEIQKRHPTFH
jgi:HEAT repeat protein